MHFSSLSLFNFGLALSSPATLKRQQTASVVHESAPVLPKGWNYVSKAEPSTPVSLSIALRQPKLNELKSRIEQTSNPKHSDYGSHLSADQVRLFRSTDPQSIELVTEWLEKGGIDEIAVEGPWIRFNSTVEAANTLLECDLEYYKQDGKTPVLRARNYSLPTTLNDHVDFVFPVSQFIATPDSRTRKSKISTPSKRQSSLPSSCLGSVTPDCIVSLYNLTYTPPEGPSPSRLGIAGFLEQYANEQDVQEFLAKYSPHRNSTTFSSNYTFAIELINNGTNPPSGHGVEATLDVEYSMAFTQPLGVTYYSTGGRGPELSSTTGQPLNASQSGNEPWLQFLEYMVAKDSIPQVLSISYTDDEQTIPEPYARRVCDLFAQLAARGVSVLVASGDGGAAGIGYNECVSNDGAKKRKFLATFPASCPYVTTVGATANYAPIEGADYSSGGFSEYFARPAWQEHAVTRYLEAVNGSHAGWYNASGRGYPDVSAVGSKYLIHSSGFEWTQTGTSASTPVVAAMVALINDKRLRSGKPALGFLNPLLYSEDLKAAFNDITGGQGGSCSFSDTFESGWEAAEGWDPLTGVGTPNFGKLLDVIG